MSECSQVMVQPLSGHFTMNNQYRKSEIKEQCERKRNFPKTQNPTDRTKVTRENLIKQHTS